MTPEWAEAFVDDVLEWSFMGFDDLADPTVESGDGLGCFVVPQRFKKRCAARQVGEYNSGVDTH